MNGDDLDSADVMTAETVRYGIALRAAYGLRGHWLLLVFFYVVFLAHVPPTP